MLLGRIMPLLSCKTVCVNCYSNQIVCVLVGVRDESQNGKVDLSLVFLGELSHDYNQFTLPKTKQNHELQEVKVSGLLHGYIDPIRRRDTRSPQPSLIFLWNHLTRYNYFLS